MKLSDFFFHAISRIDEPWYAPLVGIANSLKLLRHPERTRKLGPENPDKTFYVIEGFSDGVGLASWYDRALGFMLRAEKKGWIPVVKMERNAFGDSWDMYFEVYPKVPISEVMQSSRVVFANKELVAVYKRLNPANIVRRHRIGMAIRLVPNVRDFVDKGLESIFANNLGQVVVGAYLRGTDYRVNKNWVPVGHAKVPSVGQFVNRLRQDCERWGIEIGSGECFFFVTEEQELLDGLLSFFPKARYVQKERFSNFQHGVCLPHQTLPHTSREENNRLYLLDLYALSRCDYLVGPMNSGIQMALNLNGGRYRRVDIVNLGTN